MDPAITPVIIVAVAFAAQLIFQRSLTSRYDYQCGHCGQTFSLAPWMASVAPHRFGGRKFVACPHCGVRSWVSPVPKQ
ncbi:MAG: zinc ribbon domain-containing protein [Nocardiopsaceae bacterium]|nr:zinc ribbon domain-containing protein [Nocardiopsaceae bacterium]